LPKLSQKRKQKEKKMNKPVVLPKMKTTLKKLILKSLIRKLLRRWEHLLFGFLPYTKISYDFQVVQKVLQWIFLKDFTNPLWVLVNVISNLDHNS